MHTYQEELVNQKLGSEISDTEIEQYYSQNTGMFHANQPYIQGLFMKVPVGARHLNNVRAWYKKIRRKRLISWKNSVLEMQ